MLTIPSPPQFSKLYAAVAGFAADPTSKIDTATTGLSSDCATVSCIASRLTIAVTTNYHAIRATLPGDTTDFGFTVSARESARVFDSLSDFPATIALESDSLKITQKCSVFRLNTVAAPAPKFRGLALSPIVQADAAPFAQAIARVLPVTGTDAADLSRRNHDGKAGSILVDWAANSLALTAFDGSQLVTQSMPATVPDAATGPIVPAAFLRSILPLIRAEAAPVRLGFDQSTFSIRFGRFVAAVRLTQGRFLPWRSLVADPLPYRVTIAAAAFLEAVEQATVLRSRDSHSIRLAFGDASIRFLSRAGEVGSSEIAIPCPEAAAPFEIVFPSDSLKRAFSPITKETAHCAFSASNLSEIRSENYNFRLCPIVDQ